MIRRPHPLPPSDELTAMRQSLLELWQAYTYLLARVEKLEQSQQVGSIQGLKGDWTVTVVTPPEWVQL